MRASISHQEPGASGLGGVPGYLVPASLADIMIHLRDECHMRDAKSVFCDIGCGDGRPIMAAAEAAPRIAEASGFDVDPITLLVARRNLERFADRRWDGSRYVHGHSPTPRLSVQCKDLQRVDTLDRATHAYSFCYGMTDELIHHILRVAANTPTLRYLVLVYKRLRGDAAHEFVCALRRDCPAAVHDFVDPATSRSLLRMPNQVVHGCCVNLKATGVPVRQSEVARRTTK